MKFKASYFNISGALIHENLRRFWPVPVIGFLVYFLSGVFPILMNYKNLENMADYINLSLSNQQPFFMAVHLFLPIISAVLVFRYLQSVSSVSVVHAMPFHRGTLFCSNFLSGMLLSISPVILNGLILLLIAKPVYTSNYTYDAMSDTNIQSTINVFSRLSIGHWMLETFVIVLFLFAIAVFAGIVAGNSLMHFFLALSFNFLIPLLYGTCLWYFNQYLYGFTYSGFATDFGLGLSPYLHVLTEGGSFSAIHILCYLLASTAIAAFSLFLYQKRKLERTTDTLVFSFMQPVICYLIAFFAMTLFGIYFYMLEETNLYRVCGYVAGTLIGFLLGQMIVKKTVRIFNKISLKYLGAYVCLMALLFSALIFDFTGYEQRIPAENQIASVQFQNNLLLSATPQQNSDISYMDKNNISALSHFHRQLITQRKDAASLAYQGIYDNITLHYTLKNGATLSRSYPVSKLFLRSDQTLKPLFESKEYRTKPLLSTIEKNQFNYLNLRDNPNALRNETLGNSQTTISDKAHIAALAQALSKDILETTYEQLLTDYVPLASLDFGYNTAHKVAASVPEEAALAQETTTAIKSAEPATKETQWMGQDLTFNLLPHYKHTIAWLASNGYGVYTLPASQAAAFMTISHITATYNLDSNNKLDRQTLMAGTFSQVPDSNEFQLVVTDKEEMKLWFSYCENSCLDFMDYYQVSLYTKSQNGYVELMSCQINTIQVPTEIKAYFDERNHL